MAPPNRLQRSFQVDLHPLEPNDVVVNMGEYASPKLNCCFNHDDRPYMVEYFKQCSRFLAQNPANELGERCLVPIRSRLAPYHHIQHCGGGVRAHYGWVRDKVSGM